MSFIKAQKSRQRPHRERGQLAEREGLGILEKKKDYKARSRVFHQKQKQLKSLRKKALTKNPDEFYFKMIHKKLQDGKHWIDNPHAQDETMTSAQRKLIETQDLNYVTWKLQLEKKRVKRLEESITINECGKVRNRHIKFVDSKSMEKPFDSNEDPPINEGHLKLKEELVQRHLRLKELKTVSEKMNMQRIIGSDSGKGRELVKKENKTNSAIYKWVPMRKK